MRMAFFGSDAIALPLLDWLVGEGSRCASLVAVYTQPDRPVGRGQQVQPNAIKRWALERGLPVLQPARLTEDDRLALNASGAELGLVMAYGHILKDAFIATPRLGMVNFHASILPSYRGASPIQTAVASGERETGVSLMRIVRALDAGPVADVERVPIAPEDTALEVETKLAVACVPLLARNIDALMSGTLAFREQEHASATFCRKLVKEDGVLDFGASAASLAARINGLFPWPATAVQIAGQPIKFALAVAERVPQGEGASPPGTVLSADASGLRIAAGAGVLCVRRLQRPGGRILPAGEFLRGFPIVAGQLLPSVPHTQLLRRQ